MYKFFSAVVCCAMTLNLHAEPNGVKEEFEGKLLPENRWSVVKGEPGRVSIHNKSLWIFPAAPNGTALLFRYYPLRDDKNRPAFESFSAELTLRLEPASAPVSFALSSGAWRLSLEFSQKPEPAAKLVLVNGQERVESRQIKTAAPPDGKITLEMVYHPDRSVEAYVSSAGKRTPVAQWCGIPPQIVNFEIGAETDTASPDAARIESFEIHALPMPAGYSQMLPRPGIPLPGDASLPEKLRSFGGDYLGGFLWGKGESPAIPAQVANMGAAAASFVLKTWTTDWQDSVVARSDIPINLDPYEIRNIPVPVPDSSYGFFHLNFQLVAKDGSALEAVKTCDFGITAAPLPKDLPSKSSVGIHWGPFGRIGAKWVRFWDNGGQFFWSSIERKKGDWDWAPGDACLQRTLDAGIEPLIVLAGTPEWASSDTSYANYMGRGSFSPPKNIEEWKNYCGKIAARYKGKVKYYEVWNEPNNENLKSKGYFFYGFVEDYFKLLKAAHEAVKAVDPDAKIIAPSGTGHFFPFLEAIVKLGGLKYFDILSIHTYCVPLPPEIGYHFNGEKSYKYRVERSREIMAGGGEVKPIWNTEIGYQNDAPKVAGVPMRPDQYMKESLPGKWPNIYAGWPFRWGDQRRFAAFTTRFYILSMAYGVEKLFYHHRLIDDRVSPRMTAPAVGFFSRMLGQAAYDREFKWADNFQAHGFKLEDGRYCVAFWRVEPETLLMNHALDKKAGKVGSAPLLAAGQAGITTMDSLPRDEYFFPKRIVPTSLRVNGAAIEKAYDMWGNEIAAKTDMPVEEAPTYLVFARNPESLAAEIMTGTPASAPQTPDTFSTGKITESFEAKTAPQSPAEMIPSLRVVPPKAAKLGSRNEQHGSTFYVRSTEPLVLDLPDNCPSRGRIMISARCEGFDYLLDVGGKKYPVSQWLAWPKKVLGRGEGWQEVQGILVSPVIDFTDARTLGISCTQNEGRLYSIWIWPSSEGAH
ncbi:MAG: endo-1,4-beta-xylanase [Victivallales bacterium]